MGKDPQIIAEKELNKAELYYNAEQYKKAGKYFNASGDEFFKLKEYKIARECFLYAAKSFDFENKNFLTMEALRNAGNSSLFIDEFSNSNKYFKQALNFVSYLRRDRDLYYILYSSLSFLCLFLEGKQDQGLTYLKEIKKNVDNTYFKGSPLIGLVKNLIISIRDKNEKYIDKIEENIQIYQFRDAEIKLLKAVLVLARTHITLKTDLSIDKDQYTTKDIINLSLKIDTQPLLEISQNTLYNYKIEEIKINGIELALSDNITAKKKPNLPVTLKSGEDHKFEFLLKTHFQVDNPFIGPILLSCELDKKFIFFREDQQILKPNLISPPPSLEISMKNLRPPLIGKSFPMEILIENKSEGDALDLNIEIEFPKQLKIIRGTIKKQIYTLGSNDKMTWEIALKPIEAGDYNIKMDIKYKDPDQNQIEETKNFPFPIKL